MRNNINQLLLNEEMKDKIINNLPNEKQIMSITKFFSMFADSTRLKIIICLSIRAMTVSDMSQIMSANQTTISHQLQLMRHLNIVKTKRAGKNILYMLDIKYTNEIMENVIDNCI